MVTAGEAEWCWLPRYKQLTLIILLFCRWAQYSIQVFQMWKLNGWSVLIKTCDVHSVPVTSTFVISLSWWFSDFLFHRGTFTADPESTSSAGWVSDGWSSISSGCGSNCGCGGISQVLYVIDLFTWSDTQSHAHIHTFCLLFTWQ